MNPSNTEYDPEKNHRENPDDWFSPEETDRRMTEAMSRMVGRPRSMNMKTGQNLSAPFIAEDDLARRGYPCECDFE